MRLPRPSAISTNPLTEQHDSRRATVEFILVSLIWGSTWLVIKGQLGVVPAAWSVAYRFVIAAALLFAIALGTGRWQRPTRAVHAFALVAGVAQFALNFNLVYAAERHVTSGLIALVFALLVVPNALLARIFLKSPISLRFISGSAIGIAGLGLVFANDLRDPAIRGTIGPGIVLAVVAVLCASTANVMQAGGRARAQAPLPTLVLMMFYGALADIPYAAVTAGLPVFDGRAEYWAGLVYLAVVASAVAFTAYYALIRRIGPGPAAYTGVVIPVVAMTLSTLFEAYRWTLTSGCGAVLAITGLAVALGNRQVTQARRPAR